MGEHRPRGMAKFSKSSWRWQNECLGFCCLCNLCVINTFFQNKACHKVSWRCPRSKHWHQLCNTRAYHRADCDTDQSLIASRVKLKPRKIYHFKQKEQPCIDTSKTPTINKNNEFIVRLEETLTNCQEQNAGYRWNSIRNSIYSLAMLTYGKKKNRNTNWYDTKRSLSSTPNKVH